MMNPDTFDELEAMVDGTTEGSEFIGDPMDENPPETITRIYVQNLNGLTWNKDGGRWPYICETMEAIQADIACFSELNTDTNRYEIRTKMEELCRHQFDQHHLVLASSANKTASHYKPGGTAILARNAVTSRIKSHTRDRMGRWASISFTISTTKKLRVISAYQVCANTRPGTNTAASHQNAQIIAEHIHAQETRRRTPREVFVQELKNFIMQVQAEGEEIILVGDFNEDITSPGAGMQQLASACCLVDLFSIRLGTSTLPTTYQRGTRRLDYVLISPNLLQTIEAAGYDPFGYRLPSDHRGMYIDLRTETLFSQGLPQIPAATKRDFRTSSPGVVSAYVFAKMKYLQDHRFFERLQTLEDLHHSDHDLAESLDRDFQRASHHAAGKCTKRPRAPWSPQLAQAWAELHYYRIIISAKRTNVNYLPAIQKLQNQWPELPQEYPTNVEELQARQRQALQKLKEVRTEAQKLREEFLTKRHAYYTGTEDRQKAKILQRIIRAESQHQVYMKIKNIRNQDSNSFSLSSIKVPKDRSLIGTEDIKQVPDNTEYWETVTVPEEIERLLIQRNRQHFSQAEGTPFTQQPLQADVGYKADGYAANLILSGQIDYTSTSAATSLFIKHLQTKTVTVLDGTITEEDVLQKLQHWDERTSTSPSGIHLGHYHCTWRDPQMNPADPARDIVLKYQKMLLKAIVSLLNYALKFGHTFDRWTKIVNVMLQKDPGNPRIHRLRIIHLYEADYNLMLAVKWRQALHHAEDHKLLNSGLYGSRPGRSAHDPAFLEVMQNEIYRMSMKSGINFDLDASSCYDRILTSLAALSSRRVGMSPAPTLVNNLTLEKAKYHLKTKLGISEQFYSHSSSHPIHGTGQGSGNSPTIWCFLCSVLFDAYESTAQGATFSDYQNKTSLPIFMIGFVDDCTQRANLFNATPQPSSYTLIDMMERDAQLWNDLLWASGGALEQSKCSFHLIESDWTTNGHPFLKGGTATTTVKLQQSARVTRIKQKSNYDAHKTLGCYINPAYTRTQPWKAIVTKNENFAQLLETNFFTRSETWTFYSSIYLPSITYSLPITPLTKEQCTQLDSRFLRALLPRSGYNRNMSRAIRYAPFHMGGAGFKELYMEQGALMIQQVQKYLNSPQTPIGKMLIMAVSWTQAFLGTSKFFLAHPHHPIPPAGPSFLLDLRAFLQHINGSIQLQHPPVPDMLRQHDRSIMDIVLSQQQWSKTQVGQINACRRFLQAQTLADITNLTGTRILSTAITGDDGPNPGRIRVSMFNQKRPQNRIWKTWRRFLFTISDRYGVLRQPLDKWTTDVSKVRHWPPFLYNPITDELMSHSQFSQYVKHHRYSSRSFSIRPTDQVTEASGYPTATNITMDTLRSSFNFIPTTLNSGPLVHVGMSTHVNIQQWESSLVGNCRIVASLEDIALHVSTGNLITCSDGSATTTTGSFGFVIATPEGQRLVYGNGPAPGAYPNSFRSEAYGVLATVRWLHHAFRYSPTDGKPTITHYLDNTSVIRRIERTTKSTWEAPNQKLMPEQDVIDEIAATLHTLPIVLDIKWVKGHQDLQSPYEKLSLEAQLNCDADREAESWTNDEHSCHQLVPPLPTTPSQLVIQQRVITAHLKRRVHDSVTIPRLLSYLQQRFLWDDNVITSIDWTMYQQIIKTYKDRWTTIVKHLHAISPTGHIAHRNNPYLPHECPLCNHPHEDNNHIITCAHPSRAQWRHQTLTKIIQYSEGSVDPHLVDILREGLSRFHRRLVPMTSTQYPPRYTNLINCQNAIGWDHIYRGKWSDQWQNLQDQYISTSSNTSAPATILGLGRILIDQWLHLWKLRNEDRHGVDNRRHSQLREHTLHAELHDLYTYRMLVCPSDRNIFYDSPTDHTRNHPSLDALEDWILTYRPVILASAELATRLGVSRTHTLHTYSTFSPIPHTSEQASLTAGLSAG